MTEQEKQHLKLLDLVNELWCYTGALEAVLVKKRLATQAQIRRERERLENLAEKAEKDSRSRAEWLRVLRQRTPPTRQ